MEIAKIDLTLRISAADYATLTAATTECGQDPAAAIRQIIALLARRIEAGGHYFQAMSELREAWMQPSEKAEIEELIQANRKDNQSD